MFRAFRKRRSDFSVNEERMGAALVHRIYERSFAPESWPSVLRDVSKVSDSAGALLFVTNPGFRA